MTEEEILEYRNSYMGFLNSIKEIYKSMESNLSAHLDICKFAPDIGDGTLKNYLNDFASKEEPLDILCIGKAKKNTGFLAGLLNCYTNFIVTPQTLYLDSTAIKFSEIESIDYRYTTKTSLFGNTKIESFLKIITKNSDTAKTFKGDIAVQVIAEFLNAIVKAFNENPPEEIPAKEYPRSKLIENTLNDLKISFFNPGFNHKEVNSIIIKFGKDELKASFAANYGSYKKELYLSNENLYFFSSGDWERIPYTDLLKAVYKEEENLNSEGEIEVAYETSLYDKNNKIVFSTSENSVNEDKKFADFFSMIISDATGKEVKTEVKVKKVSAAKKREIQIKDLIIEEASKDKNLSAYKVDGHFTDLDKAGIVPCLELKKNYKYWAFCLDSVMFADGNDPWEKIPYQTMSKAVLKRVGSADVELIIYDINGKKCFSFREDNYFSTDFRVISKSLADLINKIISELSGNVVKTECIDSRTLNDLMKYSGGSSSDKFNNLLNKWNDIFLKEIPIVYRKYTIDEKNKLPEWITYENDFFTKKFSNDYVHFMGNDMRSAVWMGSDCCAYIPDLYSKNQKMLIFKYFNLDEHSCMCSLRALSGDTSVKQNVYYENYNGEENKNFNNGQRKFPESPIGLVVFFNLLGKEEFARNYCSFEERLKKAEEEGLQAEEKAKQDAADAAVKAEQEAKQNLMDDLNNW